MYVDNLVEDITIRRCAEDLVKNTLLSAEVISQITIISVDIINNMISMYRIAKSL